MDSMTPWLEKVEGVIPSDSFLVSANSGGSSPRNRTGRGRIHKKL